MAQKIPLKTTFLSRVCVFLPFQPFLPSLEYFQSLTFSSHRSVFQSQAAEQAQGATSTPPVKHPAAAGYPRFWGFTTSSPMACYTSFPVKITLASPPPHAPSPPGLRVHFPFPARSTSTQALTRITACSHHTHTRRGAGTGVATGSLCQLAAACLAQQGGELRLRRDLGAAGAGCCPRCAAAMAVRRSGKVTVSLSPFPAPQSQRTGLGPAPPHTGHSPGLCQPLGESSAFQNEPN